MMSFKVLVVSAALCAVAVIAHPSSTQPQHHNSAISALKKVYSSCEDSSDLVKCLKVQAVKITERALKLNNIRLVDGFTVVKAETPEARAFTSEPVHSEAELSQMSSSALNQKIFSGIDKFVSTHEVDVDVPRLFTFGRQEGARMVEEGRKKMKKFYGPFMGALAIKTAILTMAYNSIAVIAGKALIIGKIALIISAIIGLKKLVTPEGHEKTTYEVVKHPHISQSHSFSQSHGEFDSHDNSAGYHRSAENRAFRGYVQRA